MTIKHLYPVVEPSLNLDFANSKKLDPRITFIRGSIGTYVGEDGLIKTAVDHEARFDHDSDGNSLGLLVEESRANLLLRSEEFDDAGYWSATGCTVSPNEIASPAGTVTAEKQTHTAAGPRISKFGVATVAASTQFTFSFFAKAGTSSYAAVSIYDGTTTGNRFWFNIATGVPGSIASIGGGYPSVTSQMEAFANGWYRCICTITNGSNTTVNIDGISVSLDTDGVLGPTVSGVYGYIWGAQLEAGSFPTSYIPTTSNTVTRAADVVDLTNTGIYDTYSFTILNEPFGSAAGGSTLSLVGAGETPIKRTAVYNQYLTQTQINASVDKTDEFWRWRILGSSFALPDFTTDTDGQVTVDWGDGTVETLTTSEHTFTDGGGYHDIGFRLDSGTYFRPNFNNNASHDTKVVAVGPAPESMILYATTAFNGCTNLKVFDATIDATGGTSVRNAWLNCSSLISLPWFDTSSVTDFYSACRKCTSLASFPAIDTSLGTNFQLTWEGNAFSTFPALNFSSATIMGRAWSGCSNLTAFPALSAAQRFSSAMVSGSAPYGGFQGAWASCSSLTTFPPNIFDDVINCTRFDLAFTNCALTAQSIENILVSIDTANTSNGTLGLNGGTNAGQSTWTAAATTAYNNLIGRGWTISANA